MRPGAGAQLRASSYFAAWAVGASAAGASAAAAQGVPPDTVVALAELDRRVVGYAGVLEREVWPELRFDSVGLLYLAPGRAKLAVRWPAEPPSGMQALPGWRGHYWADTAVVRWRGGLPVATVVVNVGQTRGDVIGLALHEAFHAYEVKRVQPGRSFGRGENALITARYPVIDVENEAMFAVESRLLRRAVAARSDGEAARHAAQFVALRAHRQARLDERDGAFATFEKQAEMHEGLAQYVMLRGLSVLGERDAELRSSARLEREREASMLDSTLAVGSRSVRRRFYATGSHLGLLLDRLVGATWKQRVQRDDQFLEDVLAGAIQPEPLSAVTREEVQAATVEASRAVAALAARRQAQRDSVLAQPGVRLVLDPTGTTHGRFDWCSFDPQNLLTTGTGQTLHMRALDVCVAGARIAQFARAVVEDALTGTLHAVVDSAALTISMRGSASPPPAAGERREVQDVRIDAPGASIQLAHALLVGGNRRLLVVPLR